MTYCFVNLPLKKPIQPGQSKSLALSAEALAELASLAPLRTDAYKVFDRTREALERSDSRSLMATNVLREELIQTSTSTAVVYLKRLQEVCSRYPLLERALFYFWGTSISERLNHAFDDIRYEALGLYFNLAATHHAIAVYLLHVPTGSPITEAMEKEAYSNLCTAAAYLTLAAGQAKAMVTEPRGTATHATPEDAKPPFLDMLHCVVISEAQLIGLEKAIRNEANKNKEIVPKLTHRAFALLHEANELASKHVNSTSGLYKELVTWIRAQEATLEALLYAQVAPCRFDAAPSEGLWFSKKAGELLTTAVAASRGLVQDKRQLEWLFARARVVEHGVDRLRQINTLVTREKVGEGPYALPPAQELARDKNVDSMIVLSPPPKSQQHPASPQPPQGAGVSAAPMVSAADFPPPPGPPPPHSS